MAKRTHVQLICDLTGIVDGTVETYRFGWQGEEYEMELSAKGAAMLVQTVERYKAKARRVASNYRRSPAKVVWTSSGEDRGPGRKSSPERVWWWENKAKLGVPFQPRGSVPEVVRQAYQAAVLAREAEASVAVDGETHTVGAANAGSNGKAKAGKAEVQEMVKTQVPPAGKAAQLIKTWWGGLTVKQCKDLGIEPRKTQYGRVPAAVAEAYEAHLAKTNK